MKGIPCFLVFLFVLIFGSASFAAAPGSLDSSFAIGGKLFFDLPQARTIVSVLSQPDGKLILIGSANNGTNDDFLLIRLTSKGALDTTFDGDGLVLTDFGGIDRASDVAIQNDGKIIVVGTVDNGSGVTDSAIARYLPGGALDTSFSGDGKAILTNFPGMQGDAFWTVICQPDGKIVAGGSAPSGFLLARFDASGSLDSSFGASGITVTSGGTFVRDVRDVFVLGDGKLIAAGGSSRSVVARYNADGSLDASFGGSGISILNFGFYAQATAYDIAPDGKIILAGAASPTNDFSGFVARLTSLGVPDNTFGNGGIQVTDLNPGGADFFNDVSLDSEGRVVAIGYTGDSSTWDPALVRYNNDGSTDQRFGIGGKVVRDLGGEEPIYAATIVGDKLVAVGNRQLSLGIYAMRFDLLTAPSSSSDFDGDGFSDYAVFRPSTATWYIQRSTDNTVQIVPFGTSGDIPLDGDFDGDGRTDLAIFRPSAGQWWVSRSSSGSAFAVQFGQSTDKPSVGDYDKDGRTDIAFWRPSTGVWNVLRSSDGFTSYFGVPFGASGDIPIGAAPQ